MKNYRVQVERKVWFGHLTSTKCFKAQDDDEAERGAKVYAEDNSFKLEEYRTVVS